MSVISLFSGLSLLYFLIFTGLKSRICSFPVDISFLSVHNKEKVIIFQRSIL